MKNILRSLALAGACGLASLVNAESSTNSVDMADSYSTNAVSYVDSYTNSFSNAYTKVSSNVVNKADSLGKVYSLAVAPVKSANLENAVASTNVSNVKIADSVKYPEFTSISFLTEGNTCSVELIGQIYAGDTNHYCLQTRSSLTAGSWIDSTDPENRNICSNGREAQFYAAEPYNSSNKFYRLVQNEVAN